MTQQAMDKILKRELSSKEKAFNAGCLGALTDVIKLCHDFNSPLPKWASSELSKALGGLMVDDKARIRSWRSWFNRYTKDMADYEIYEEVKQAREHGIEWRDIYDVIASIVVGRVSDTQTETIKKTYTRTNSRLKSDPFRYHVLSTIRPKTKISKYNPLVWEWIGTTKKAGKPRKQNKDDMV